MVSIVTYTIYNSWNLNIGYLYYSVVIIINMLAMLTIKVIASL